MNRYRIFIALSFFYLCDLQAQNDQPPLHSFWITASGPFMGLYDYHYQEYIGVTGEANYRFKNNVFSYAMTSGGQLAENGEVVAWQLTAGRRFQKSIFYLQGSTGLAGAKGDYEDDYEDMQKYRYLGIAAKAEAGIYIWKYFAITGQVSGIYTKGRWNTAWFYGLSVGNLQ